MPSITSLVNKLKKDHPDIKFVKSDVFCWYETKKTILYIEKSPDWPELLHELAHARLNHQNYSRDIELISMEREAWELAKNIANKYNLDITDETIEKHLNSYRNWLASRSSCPKCQQSGFQIDSNTYKCPACFSTWKVNQAKTNQLRRQLIKNK